MGNVVSRGLNRTRPSVTFQRRVSVLPDASSTISTRSPIDGHRRLPADLPHPVRAAVGLGEPAVLEGGAGPDALGADLLGGEEPLGEPVEAALGQRPTDLLARERSASHAPSSPASLVRRPGIGCLRRLTEPLRAPPGRSPSPWSGRRGSPLVGAEVEVVEPGAADRHQAVGTHHVVPAGRVHDEGESGQLGEALTHHGLGGVGSECPHQRQHRDVGLHRGVDVGLVVDGDRPRVADIEVGAVAVRGGEGRPLRAGRTGGLGCVVPRCHVAAQHRPRGADAGEVLGQALGEVAQAVRRRAGDHRGERVGQLVEAS